MSVGVATTSPVQGESLIADKNEESRTNGDKPRVLLSHPTGNENVRNALLSLVEHEMLAEFLTTIAWDAQSRWNTLLSGELRTQLARRSFSLAHRDRIKSMPWREAVRVVMRATPLARFLTADERPFSIIGVYRDFDRRVARRVADLQPNIAYAYEGGALQTFREAKKRGVTTIYEQPSGHWRWTRNLFAEEAERNPGLSDLLPSLRDSAGHLDWKDEELQLSDHIFVPSEYIMRTLAGVVPESKIRVFRYGAPEVKPDKQFNLDSDVPLKVLFVGHLGQHKGIGYLLDAVDMLGEQVELTLVGRRLRPNARIDQACRRWHWHETLPHEQVLRVMQQADVLVLPSLSDAFGLVVTEALSCGLPVIVTPNTGASEIIRDGHDGFVVPVCQADAIASRLEAMHRDREMLAEMARQAQVTAARNCWANYRANWARAVRSLAWQ